MTERKLFQYYKTESKLRVLSEGGHCYRRGK